MKWRLGFYVIEEYHESDAPSYGWTYPAPDDYGGDKPLIVWGRAWVEGNFLVLGLSKVRAFMDHSVEEWEEFRESLPPWDKTRYVIGYLHRGAAPIYDVTINQHIELKDIPLGDQETFYRLFPKTPRVDKRLMED